MKKFSIFLSVLFGLGMFLSCNSGKTYAELKDEERESIQRYLELNNITVIDEQEFQEQDSTTDVSANEYVLFSESGVYMQVIERGKGEMLEDGRHEFLVRYVEELIDVDGSVDTLSLNTVGNLYPHPDEFVLTKTDDYMSASFASTGSMYAAHGSAYVPGGWLLPLNYVKVGRETSARSKVRLIVPHSEGTSTASSQVKPCFYEITYQLSR